MGPPVCQEEKGRMFGAQLQSRPVKNCGNFTGRMTASFRESLAPSSPATSSHCASIGTVLLNSSQYHLSCADYDTASPKEPIEFKGGPPPLIIRQTGLTQTWAYLSVM